MAYNFTDRLKEWTSYAGLAAAGLAAALPQVIPADSHWVQLWQGVQMLVGAALVFVPQTAGTTAIENDSWTLLKAFTAGLPPEYAAGVQPLVSTLAAHLARIEAGVPVPTPVAPAPVPAPAPVMAVPVVAAPIGVPTAPLVANPAQSLSQFGS